MKATKGKKIIRQVKNQQANIAFAKQKLHLQINPESENHEKVFHKSSTK